MGAPINARRGLNTWAAFVGTNDKAAVTAEVAMLANKVTPVLKVLHKCRCQTVYARRLTERTTNDQ